MSLWYQSWPEKDHKIFFVVVGAGGKTRRDDKMRLFVVSQDSKKCKLFSFAFLVIASLNRGVKVVDGVNHLRSIDNVV